MKSSSKGSKLVLLLDAFLAMLESMRIKTKKGTCHNGMHKRGQEIVLSGVVKHQYNACFTG